MQEQRIKWPVKGMLVFDENGNNVDQFMASLVDMAGEGHQMQRLGAAAGYHGAFRSDIKSVEKQAGAAAARGLSTAQRVPPPPRGC